MLSETRSRMKSDEIARMSGNFKLEMLRYFALTSISPE